MHNPNTTQNTNGTPNESEWSSLNKLEFSGDAVETRFSVNPDDFPIFSKQAGIRDRYDDGHSNLETLSINETLGLMVGKTAETIAVLVGDDKNIPAADHVIYLDKSARPVSWLVDAFWEDFTDKEKPRKDYLAIDRKKWFERSGVKLLPNEYIEEPGGAKRPAMFQDFDINKIPREMLARIRSVFIEGGIESEDVEEIMSTPTVLDGKNITIIDEVSRSGSTINIAKALIAAAIPEARSVNGHVFWSDNFKKTDSGETQMGATPVWYPHDKRDWRGRGVKNINPEFFKHVYEENPTPKNRANHFGSIVIGEPLNDPNDEPGQLSWKLSEEIKRMHSEYEKGHILPRILAGNTAGGEVDDKMSDYLESLGVEFAQPGDAKNPRHTYVELIKKRDKLPDIY